jgi:hypothetical protein
LPFPPMEEIPCTDGWDDNDSTVGEFIIGSPDEVQKLTPGDDSCASCTLDASMRSRSTAASSTDLGPDDISNGSAVASLSGFARWASQHRSCLQQERNLPELPNLPQGGLTAEASAFEESPASSSRCGAPVRWIPRSSRSTAQESAWTSDSGCSLELLEHPDSRPSTVDTGDGRHPFAGRPTRLDTPPSSSEGVARPAAPSAPRGNRHMSGLF